MKESRMDTEVHRMEPEDKRVLFKRILDDIAAVLIIAVYYTSDLATTPLLIALAVTILLIILNMFGVKTIVLAMSI